MCTCGVRRCRRRVSPSGAQVRERRLAGALCGAALEEAQPPDTADDCRQAPGPPLRPRDEPLAQTGPERFVRSARVRQGWLLSISPGAGQIATQTSVRHRHRHHMGPRDNARSLMGGTTGSHQAPPALPADSELPGIARCRVMRAEQAPAGWMEWAEVQNRSPPEGGNWDSSPARSQRILWPCGSVINAFWFSHSQNEAGSLVSHDSQGLPLTSLFRFLGP